MDARKSDLLPPEHLTYDVFDQQSARIALGELVPAPPRPRKPRAPTRTTAARGR